MRLQRDEHRHIMEDPARLCQHANVGGNSLLSLVTNSKRTTTCSPKFFESYTGFVRFCTDSGTVGAGMQNALGISMVFGFEQNGSHLVPIH